jgi:phosphoglycolate phosphatase-like HAD superfamily hydrolase
MIGDAMSDMLAAKESSIDFIFMSDYSTSDEMKQDKSLKTIKNLGDLI